MTPTEGQTAKAPRMNAYGWDACKLADAYSREELVALRLQVENDPKNAEPGHATGKSIYLYCKSARRKLDAIGWAVFYQMEQKRKTP